jgi:hypothetical protein
MHPNSNVTHFKLIMALSPFLYKTYISMYTTQSPGIVWRLKSLIDPSKQFEPESEFVIYSAWLVQPSHSVHLPKTKKIFNFQEYSSCF